MRFLRLWLMLLLAACATATHRPAIEVPKPTQTPTPIAVVAPVPMVIIKGDNTPIYALPASAGTNFRRAIELITEHANTEEFWKYVANKRTYFSHTDKQSVNESIVKFRRNLAQEDIITIEFYDPFWPSAAIGGWINGKIRENTEHTMDAIERAGHILHESSHAYGFSHKGNYTNKFDNVNSFPYAIGYDFRDYLIMKTKPAIAKE